MSRFDPVAAARLARAVHAAFRAQHAGFNAITGRAAERFVARDWSGSQADALERLGLYERSVSRLVTVLLAQLAEVDAPRTLWRGVKRAYAHVAGDAANAELAQTFFNSVARRLFSTVGVEPELEFVSLDSPVPALAPDAAIVAHDDAAGDTAARVRRLLADAWPAAAWRDLAADADAVARRLEARVGAVFGRAGLEAIELLRPPFYRSKAAYLVGRIRTPGRILPLVLPLVHDERGVAVDAVLTETAEVSILFSFTRTHFHVLAERPAELIAFLKTILPLKPVAELYIALGFVKHGKTELYRALKRQLELTAARFEIAPGNRGMVMLVLALPLYDMVFKVIRDVFDYPKQTTAREVRERYKLVFERDRVGRMVEAQEFEHLEFRRGHFTDAALAELLSSAGRAVRLTGDHVVLQHLYTERRVHPLNLYLRQVDGAAARRAIVDYGHAIKELAAANIFPGDFLLKNFGVTRHGRVVFYDYDELCLLTDCNFRHMPPPRHPDEELDPEPWFGVGEHDVFPEEFRKLLDVPAGLVEEFERHHADLYTVEFWRGLQQRHQAGEILDFFPYPSGRRL